MAQSNDHNNEIGLSTMPTEILELIFNHLNDEDLLTTSHVGKRFAAVTENIFGQKYRDEAYYIDELSDSFKFHEVILSKYGEKLQLHT